MTISKINLTTKQKEALSHAWFYFGNDGPAHTHGNHKFIQGILERGADEHSYYVVTDACLMAVESILRTP